VGTAGGEKLRGDGRGHGQDYCVEILEPGSRFLFLTIDFDGPDFDDPTSGFALN